jgi:hypothetical protein
MKSVFLIPLGILSAISFYGCASDAEEAVSSASYIPNVKSLGPVIGNSANPYDTVGLEYSNYLSAYKDGRYEPNSYPDVQAIVAKLTSDPTITQQDNILRALLTACISNPPIALEQILQQSGLSENGRQIISDFIASYQALSDQPFSSAYNSIVVMENTVSGSTALPSDDKRIILSVASFTRYSLYHSCCYDTDWRKSVGNVIAALAGAVENRSATIQYPLITSIAGLEQVQF